VLGGRCTKSQICPSGFFSASVIAVGRFWVYQPAHMPLPHPVDTIAAIATASGAGAIAIVRVSGRAAFPLADQIFRCPVPPPSERPAGTFVHGQAIHPGSGEILDDALLLVFRAPHSYTGEDSVEIQCHGGSQTARRILGAALAAGARQAEPGEFTKRAFLNDKINLTQAEAVLDLIHARSERSARLATAQLEDALGQRICSLYQELLAVTADLEAMLDFPDDEVPHTVASNISKRINVLSADIQALLNTWQEGHLLRDGARVVIAGAPNVGKSTLLNLLAGHDRAIVSPHPGTTRDTIEVEVILQGYPIHLIDTAGLRDTPCEIEQEGVRRTRHALSQADLCICLLDASQAVSPDETAFLNAHDPRTILVVLNKIDLGQKIRPDDLPKLDSLAVSLKNNHPRDEIGTKILQKLLQRNITADAGTVAISARHRDALLHAADDLNRCQNRLKDDSEAELVLAATHAQSALEQIGCILGKNYTEDMLDSIFLRFCVGK